MRKIIFEVLQKDNNSKARLGRLKTLHGDVLTPEYIPVGTAATVKSLDPHDLKTNAVQIILSNTYHLHLRPGEDLVREFGGLARFTGWNGPTMTDSGGYQVFSLGAAQSHRVDKSGHKLNKFTSPDIISSGESFIERDRLKVRKSQTIRPAEIDEEGVTFYSHLDGSKHRLDPKSSIQMQEKIGADLIVAFDDHESPLWDYEKTKESLIRTNRWGIESLKSHKRDDQLMYGVVHGGVFEDLRVESAKFTNEHFDAIAIGGSYTTKNILYQVINWSVPHFDEHKPRHLLGIGEIADILEAVIRGMDFFDCVAPTRRARHGSFYIHPESGGKVENNFTMQISNEEYIHDKNPIDPLCNCYTCSNFSRGYINHLFRARELLAYRLASLHNIRFMVEFMRGIREAIKKTEFDIYKKYWLGH